MSGKTNYRRWIYLSLFLGIAALSIPLQSCATGNVDTAGILEQISKAIEAKQSEHRIVFVYPDENTIVPLGQCDLQIYTNSETKIYKIEVLLDGKTVKTFDKSNTKMEKSIRLSVPIILTRETHIVTVHVTRKEGKAYATASGLSAYTVVPMISATLHVRTKAPADNVVLRNPQATDIAKRGKAGRVYVVAVGISQYRDILIEPLRYADRDANEFVEQIIESSDGAVRPSFVKVLSNEQATLQNIKEALTVFLKKAISEDVVFVFFSGHGSPEPDKPENMYFLTYDTDPNNMAVTALPMWDIETFLHRHIKADRVVVIADTCHSGGMGPQLAKRAPGFGDQEGSAINDYFHALAKAGPGRTIFTASEPNEVSFEDPQWGGGHGVFTYFLLEGMKGAADFDHDGIVTLGELADYVDVEVRRATNSRQHPYLTGEINRNLPVAVVGK